MTFRLPLRSAALTLAAVVAVDAALAQDAAAPAPEAGRLALSLSALSPTEAGCRLSFVVVNNRPEIADLSLDVAVFGARGGLLRLVRMSFGSLLAGKTRVRQFDLAETQCTDVGRAVVNEVATCRGDGIDPETCLRALDVSSDTPVPFGL